MLGFSKNNSTNTKDVYYCKNFYFCREDFFNNQNLSSIELIKLYNLTRGKHLKNYYPPRKPCEKKKSKFKTSVGKLF